MDTRLLELLVCPVCKGPLEHHRDAQELVCRADRLAFPVHDGIPVMLESAARVVPEPEEPKPALSLPPAP
ncbi:Trm112 family protein [Caldimonas tepidiphila]|uniref:Trm112 family protein n=1 Tax=Caldimonas tepidiphila TaxID=2315841 RepID=UPI000E5A784C|nr:Trm112 family protein [Caldimonas tepidiphila]